MCKCHKRCVKLFAGIIILIALALAISISIWNQKGLAYVVYIGRFFDIMIPVLAVGALVKYLLSGCCGGHHNMPMHAEECKGETCESMKK